MAIDWEIEGPYGLAAYGLYRIVRTLDPGFLAWDRGGPYVVGAAVAAAVSTS